MSERQKIAALTAFTAISSGPLSVLIHWLFGLIIDWLCQAPITDTNPWPSFVLGASLGLAISLWFAWTWWRTRPLT